MLVRGGVRTLFVRSDPDHFCYDVVRVKPVVSGAPSFKVNKNPAKMLFLLAAFLFVFDGTFMKFVHALVQCPDLIADL